MKWRSTKEGEVGAEAKSAKTKKTKTKLTIRKVTTFKAKRLKFKKPPSKLPDNAKLLYAGKPCVAMQVVRRRDRQSSAWAIV